MGDYVSNEGDNTLDVNYFGSMMEEILMELKKLNRLLQDVHDLPINDEDIDE